MQPTIIAQQQDRTIGLIIVGFVQISDEIQMLSLINMKYTSVARLSSRSFPSLRKGAEEFYCSVTDGLNMAGHHVPAGLAETKEETLIEAGRHRPSSSHSISKEHTSFLIIGILIEFFRRQFTETQL
jgi:hypothetical protein